MEQGRNGRDFLQDRYTNSNLELDFNPLNSPILSLFPAFSIIPIILQMLASVL